MTSKDIYHVDVWHWRRQHRIRRERLCNVRRRRRRCANDDAFVNRVRPTAQIIMIIRHVGGRTNPPTHSLTYANFLCLCCRIALNFHQTSHMLQNDNTAKRFRMKRNTNCVNTIILMREIAHTRRVRMFTWTIPYHSRWPARFRARRECTSMVLRKCPFWFSQYIHLYSTVLMANVHMFAHVLRTPEHAQTHTHTNASNNPNKVRVNITRRTLIIQDNTPWIV